MYNNRQHKQHEPAITIDKADHDIMVSALKVVLVDIVFVDADEPNKEHVIITSDFDEIRYNIAKRAIIKLFSLYKENRNQQ